MRKDRKDAAHIAVFPGKDRWIIAIEDPGDRVAVIQDGIDVVLVSCDDRRICEEILKVRFLVPGKVLAETATVACGAVPNEGDDDLHIVFGGDGKGIVRCLKSALVEL